MIPVLLLEVNFNPRAVIKSKEGAHRNRYTFKGSTYTFDQENKYFCAVGTLFNNGVCCNQSCGECGGSACGSSAEGRSECCHETHLRNARSCTSPFDTSCVIPSKNCNWQCYLDRYTDLREAFSATNVIEAEKHWKRKGYDEGRV